MTCGLKTLDTYGLSQMFLCSPSGWPLNFCASWFHQVSTGFRPVHFHVFLTNLGVRLFSRNLNLLHWSNCCTPFGFQWMHHRCCDMVPQLSRCEERKWRKWRKWKARGVFAARMPGKQQSMWKIVDESVIGTCWKMRALNRLELIEQKHFASKLLPRWFDTNKICCEICSNELLTMLTQKYEIIHLVNLCCGRFFLWLWFYSWLWRNDLICKISKSNHDFRIVFVSTHGFHPAGKVFEIHQICKSKTRSESWATK